MTTGSDPPGYDRLRNISIRDMELSVRTSNCLQASGRYKTAADLDAETDDRLLRIPHLGPRCLKEIRTAIKGIRGAKLNITEEVMLWASDHQTLVQALIRGEAVIVPKIKD